MKPKNASGDVDALRHDDADQGKVNRASPDTKII